MLKFENILCCFILISATFFLEATSHEAPVRQVKKKKILDYHKGKWDQAQDDFLIRAVASTKEIQVHAGEKIKFWRVVAQNFNALSEVKRSQKQCNERWSNHLNPDLIRGDLDEDEKLEIISLFQSGKGASSIAKKLNRASLVVRNFLNSKNFRKRISLSNSPMINRIRRRRAAAKKGKADTASKKADKRKSSGGASGHKKPRKILQGLEGVVEAKLLEVGVESHQADCDAAMAKHAVLSREIEQEALNKLLPEMLDDTVWSPAFSSKFQKPSSPDLLLCSLSPASPGGLPSAEGWDGKVSPPAIDPLLLDEDNVPWDVLMADPGLSVAKERREEHPMREFEFPLKGEPHELSADRKNILSPFDEDFDEGITFENCQKLMKEIFGEK